MNIAQMTKQDFLQIVDDHSKYWDSDLTYQLHHPIFINEFADTAYTLKDGEKIAAYLMGLISQTEPTGYVHLVAVHPDYRRQGLAKRMYEHFIKEARKRGCTKLKTTGHPQNIQTIKFHLALGMEMQGEPNGEGVNVVKDYLRRGSDRVVFLMDI
ncbi:MAG: GNAT family N-acetyltransferase [Planctomycetes bacterium]|nr:GNAT family N-acetyltransferase [Planctomycetota bacterium]